MSKPAGVIAKTKDNSRKKYRENAEWLVAKKIGRPKQQWVWDEPVQPEETDDRKGHWEKV